MSNNRYAINRTICCTVLTIPTFFVVPLATAQQPGPAAQMYETRVHPVPVEEMSTRQKDLLGIVDGQPLPERATLNLFRTLMHNPDLIEAYFPTGNAVSAAPEIDDKDRELIIMRIGWLYQGEYEWAQHYDPAIEAGWTPEDMERVKIGPGAPGWSDFDRILLLAADQLVREAYLHDEVWNALLEKYSVPDIMALITLVTHYHWVAMMTNTLGIKLEEGKTGFER